MALSVGLPGLLIAWDISAVGEHIIGTEIATLNGTPDQRGPVAAQDALV